MDLVPDLSLDEFACIHLLRRPKLMWLLGARHVGHGGGCDDGRSDDRRVGRAQRARTGAAILRQTLGYPSGGDPDEYAELRGRAELATVGVAERLGVHATTYRRRLGRGRDRPRRHRRQPDRAMTTQRQPTITEIRHGSLRHHLSDTQAASDLDSPTWEAGVR